MSNPKFIYKAEKPYQDDINDLVEKGGDGSGVRGHKTNRPNHVQPSPGSGAVLERIRAARARHASESDPKKKAKLAAEIRDGVAAYEKLNPKR